MWEHFVLPLLRSFCSGSNIRARRSSQWSRSFNYTHVIYWLSATPGFPNLIANKGDIHLTMSETVTATLSLLSLVCVDAGQPFRLHSPLIPPLLSPFITGSLNRWDHLTVGVNDGKKKEPLWFEFRAGFGGICHNDGHFNWTINFW